MRTETRPATTPAPARQAPARRAIGRALAWPLRGLGQTRARWWAEDARRPAWQGWFWTGILLVLLAGFAYKVGATDWYTQYPAELPDGRTIQLPNDFAVQCVAMKRLVFRLFFYGRDAGFLATG